MAVNFNSNSVFNLKPINVEEVRKEVDGLLIGDRKSTRLNSSHPK